ncbi:MAG: hypothetical protein ACFB15_25785 [Cyclobacteriaceae bacterium]
MNTSFEEKYTKAFQQVYQQQGDILLQQIDSNSWDAVQANITINDSGLQSLLNDLYQEAVSHAAAKTQRSLIQYNTKNEPDERQYEQYATELFAAIGMRHVFAMLDHSRSLVQRMMRNARKRFDSVPERIDYFTRLWKESTVYRAQTASETELLISTEFGSDLGAQAFQLSTNQIVMKQWDATSDMHTRSSHATANGQWQRLQDQFEVGGYKARYPGDVFLPLKEKVRCRCFAKYTVEK